MNIEIYIDRIVLEGYEHLNKRELNAAIQEQLMAMLSERGLPDSLMNNGYHRKLDGGEMDWANRPKTGQVGTDIANGIYRGINSME